MEFVDVIDEEANSPKRHDKMHDIIISYLIKPHDINMLLNGISEHYITIWSYDSRNRRCYWGKTDSYLVGGSDLRSRSSNTWQ